MKVRLYRARGFGGLGYLSSERIRRGVVVGRDRRLMLGRLVLIGQTGFLEPLERKPRPRSYPAPPAPDAYRGFRTPEWAATTAEMFNARAATDDTLAALGPLINGSDPGRQHERR